MGPVQYLQMVRPSPNCSPSEAITSRCRSTILVPPSASTSNVGVPHIEVSLLSSVASTPLPHSVSNVEQGKATSNRRIVHQARRDALRANWLILLAMAFLDALLCGALFALPGSKEWHAFLLGVFVTLGVIGELSAVHLASGTHQRSLGMFGEAATEEAVCGIWYRLRGWRHVGGLYFKRHGDVDHVLIGPRGVYAIETKWTSEEWNLVNGQLVGAHTDGILSQAADSADRIRLALNYRRAKLDVDVRPILFLWGPGAPTVPGGFEDIHGVRVVEGRWARLRHNRIFDGRPLSRGQRRAATQLLKDMSREQHIN